MGKFSPFILPKRTNNHINYTNFGVSIASLQLSVYNTAKKGDVVVLNKLIPDLMEWRNRLHVSRATLAQKSGLHLTTIWRIENGNCLPNLQTLQQIYDALIAIEAEQQQHSTPAA